MLKLAMMFRDGMVLQRDRKVAVFGTTDRRAPVFVRMQGQTVTAVPGEDGKWLAEIGPFSCSEGEEMEISQEGTRLLLKDVAFGEVYLAGGQSNMEFAMRYDRGFAKEREKLTKEANPHLRFFDYPEVSYPEQLEEADYLQEYGRWRRADADNLQWWSAVSYYFAADLWEKLQVPIGIIGCNWGGTNIGCWLPEEVLRACGAKVYLTEYEEAVKNLDPEAYEKAFRAYPLSYRTNQLEFPGSEIQDFIMHGSYGEDLLTELGKKIAEMMKKQGLPMPDAKAAAAQLPMGPKHPNRPCGLYESMLLPVVPYTLRGILWYQGESDGDEKARADLYDKTFPALIAHWRSLFRDPALPFLFVQLAPYEKWMVNTGDWCGVVRQAQKKTADAVQNTGMAVTSDEGMRWNIHPVIKSVVGHRLALLAQNRIYGDENVLCEAPLLVKAQAEDGRAVLTFQNTGGRLYLSDESLYGEHYPEGRLQGVVLSQEDRVIRSEDCSAEVRGDEVILSSPAFRGDAPLHAAIAEEHWYQVNLYNKADIPAMPADV
ncbi:MAG: sialate O-acetylesterase [Lachnospiraceae bacterium]